MSEHKRKNQESEESDEINTECIEVNSDLSEESVDSQLVAVMHRTELRNKIVELMRKDLLSVPALEELLEHCQDLTSNHYNFLQTRVNTAREALACAQAEMARAQSDIDALPFAVEPVVGWSQLRIWKRRARRRERLARSAQEK